MKIRALLAAALLSGFFNAYAQKAPPPGIQPLTVPFQIFCADSFEFMLHVLAVDFGEAPVAMGYLKEGDNPTTMVLFTNEKNTRSTIVITKKTKYDESACIVWSGGSPSGMAFSMNPDPQFPPMPKEGVEM